MSDREASTIVELTVFSDFARFLPNVRRRTVEGWSDKGLFPPYVRMSARGEPMWSRAAVFEFINAKMARLQRPTIYFGPESGAAGAEGGA